MADKDTAWVEPVYNFKSKYPHNNAMQTKSGHVQEYDDTPGAERIRIQHREGTFTEMQPDGSYVTHVFANNYTIVAGDDRVLVYGSCNIVIQGDVDMKVEGDITQTVHGSIRQVVEGDYGLVVKGKLKMSSGDDMSLSTLAATSGVYVNTVDGLNVNGDITTDGEVSADSIHSTGSVTAGTGIHAGLPTSVNPLAGISTLGGINVGMPGPTVPGVVNATTLVTAPAIIGTTITYGTILMDPEGGAPLIRSIYDMHTHIVPLGISSPPLPPMIP